MNPSRTYIGALLIAVGGILFWTLLMPSYDNMMAQRDAIGERADIIKNRTEIINNINALTKQYADRSSDIIRFSSIVPAKKSAPEIISAIQALATQNGLQLSTIALSGDVNQDNNPYQEQSIDMGMSGNYPAFKSFLMALERNVRLVDIISINASPTSDNSSLISFRVKGNAYYLK